MIPASYWYRLGTSTRRHWARARDLLGTSPVMENGGQHRLDMSALEDRVFYSASPMPVDVDVVWTGDVPLDVEPIETPLALIDFPQSSGLEPLAASLTGKAIWAESSLNTPLGLNEGAAGTIAAALPATTDVDPTPAQLVYTITSGTANGTVLLSGAATASFTQADIDAGLVTYQHDGSETVSDGFDFTVDDGQGSTTSATFSINITAAVNQPPIISPIANQVGIEDTPLGPIGFIIGDPDTPVSSLMVSTSSSNPVLIEGLTVAGSGAARTLTITPAVNQNGGPATIFVTVNDGVNTTTETLLVSFTAQNDAPVAHNNFYKTLKGKFLTIDAPGVLGNDLDVDGDALTSIVVKEPSHGLLVLAADGSFRYRPKPGYIGFDKFEYVADDGLLSSKPAAVVIAIRPELGTLPPDIEPPIDDEPPRDDDPPVVENSPEDETDPPLGNNPPVSEIPPSLSAGQNPTPEDPSLPVTVPLPPLADFSPPIDYAQILVSVRSAPVASYSQVETGLSEKFQTEVVATDELEDLRFVDQAGAFWDDLDELDELVDESGQYQQLAIGSTLGITSGLSAGYVIWLIRGGYLVSSLLAQMPAWRYIDPLPVLEYINDPQDDDTQGNQSDQESLESILETADHQGKT